MPNESWIKHAYPLQQITIKLQGTRHSSRENVINQLETVLARLKSGDVTGASHDYDFGYQFDVHFRTRKFSTKEKFCAHGAPRAGRYAGESKANE
ncbi:hypothetical protein KY495_17555 [Massilia sp. PAMC28688]|uniref:hypothetical protein n=1 Tax=Massilia sp. PAMC28688 TaxID=2861283 RepID=UPI001C62A286|nr:hypothetical protein [Massilia sp. PAMC28688]QYF92535.1 hypothetical protein KY495_17555 [Massilia sp. PAMC28688]